MSYTARTHSAKYENPGSQPEWQEGGEDPESRNTRLSATSEADSSTHLDDRVDNKDQSRSNPPPKSLHTIFLDNLTSCLYRRRLDFLKVPFAIREHRHGSSGLSCLDRPNWVGHEGGDRS